MSPVERDTSQEPSPPDLLARQSRRYVLAQLVDSSICTVDDVVETVAGETDASDRDRVRLRLYHIDLPMLFHAGLVDYDWRSGDVVRTTDAETLRRLFEHAPSTVDPPFR